MKYVTFLIYTIFFQTLIWGIAFYSVFILGVSGWWMLAALFVAGLQYSPSDFGIGKVRDNNDD